MKVLLVTAIVVLVLGLMGWIGFSDFGSRAVISIDKQEIKEDSREAAHGLAEATREAAVDAERELDELDEEAPPQQAAP
jgi:hypothetical protein